LRPGLSRCQYGSGNEPIGIGWQQREKRISRTKQVISIRKIGVVGRTYRHAKRYKEILHILIKYGFGDVVDSLKIPQHIEIGWQKISGKQAGPTEKLSRPERVRMAMEELGPTFIKLGQILSTRPDLIPLEYVQELSKLQDNVPSFPYDDVRAAMKSETGRFPEEIFRSFDETPLAAASLGQVHKAVLSDTEEEVAIKIQRPGIQKIIEIDLEIMLHIASLMGQNLKEMGILHPTRIVEEFSRSMENEIDYTVEASHIEHFARQFLDDATIYVPKVFRELTTKRILTMEYIEGIKASNLGDLKQKGYNLKEIADRGVHLIMKQIFVHGFYHADPHPGNIFILPNTILCFLDFGMMGRISRQEREDFTDLVTVILRKDERKTVDALLKLCNFTEEPDRRNLERDMGEFFDRFLHLTLKELEIKKMTQRTLQILTKNGMSLRPDLFLMAKALTTVEGLGRSLDPDFQVVKRVAPFVQDIQSKRYSPERIASDLIDSGTESIQLMKEMPRELHEVLKDVKEGRLKIGIEHRGLDRTVFKLGRISDRIASTIVLASLIIGSSIVTLSNIPPKWRGIPVIGVVGYLGAGVMGFCLLVSTLRRGSRTKND
jgi:ubiquinone biosynthesis protein